jgi:hypothetical protein
MRALDIILAFISSASAPWSQWWNQGVGPLPMPSGTPPMDYTPMTQAQLLASFSDSIGPSGITPRSLRNFVGSTVTSTPFGTISAVPLPIPGWTTATRPVGMAGPVMGFNYTLQQLDLWDNLAGVWVNPGFNGGNVTGETVFSGPVEFSGPSIEVAAPVSFSGGISATNLPTSYAGKPSGTVVNNGNLLGLVQ